MGLQARRHHFLKGLTSPYSALFLFLALWVSLLECTVRAATSSLRFVVNGAIQELVYDPFDESFDPDALASELVQKWSINHGGECKDGDQQCLSEMFAESLRAEAAAAREQSGKDMNKGETGEKYKPPDEVGNSLRASQANLENSTLFDIEEPILLTIPILFIQTDANPGGRGFSFKTTRYQVRVDDGFERRLTEAGEKKDVAIMMMAADVAVKLCVDAACNTVFDETRGVANTVAMALELWRRSAWRRVRSELRVDGKNRSTTEPFVEGIVCDSDPVAAVLKFCAMEKLLSDRCNGADLEVENIGGRCKGRLRRPNRCSVSPWVPHALYTSLLERCPPALAVASDRTLDEFRFAGYEVLPNLHRQHFDKSGAILIDEHTSRTFLEDALAFLPWWKTSGTESRVAWCVETGTFRGQTSLWLAEKAGCSSVMTIEVEPKLMEEAKSHWTAREREERRRIEATGGSKHISSSSGNNTESFFRHRIQPIVGNSADGKHFYRNLKPSTICVPLTSITSLGLLDSCCLREIKVLEGPIMMEEPLRSTPILFFLDGHYSLAGAGRIPGEESPAIRELQAILCGRKNERDVIVLDDAKDFRDPMRIPSGLVYPDITDLQDVIRECSSSMDTGHEWTLFLHADAISITSRSTARELASALGLDDIALHM